MPLLSCRPSATLFSSRPQMKLVYRISCLACNLRNQELYRSAEHTPRPSRFARRNILRCLSVSFALQQLVRKLSSTGIFIRSAIFFSRRSRASVIRIGRESGSNLARVEGRWIFHHQWAIWWSIVGRALEDSLRPLFRASWSRRVARWRNL